MSKYPDNVIPFPGLPRPVSAQKVISREAPEDIAKMLSEEPSDMEHGDNLKFLSLAPLEKLDFPIMTKPEVHLEAEELDNFLALLSDQIGDFKVKRLGEVIGNYIASIADMSYAEGLAETITD